VSGDASAGFPVPVIDQDTKPFWDGCDRRELLIQRCGSCSAWLWQPRPICSTCQTPQPLWTKVSGDAVIASWTVMRPPTLPAFASMVPFVVLLVQLDEGVRMLGYLVDAKGKVCQTDGSAECVETGRRVRLRFHDQAGTILPCWTLAE